MTLPLAPPIKPQLARSAKELPEGDGWCYEPKWDGFRTLAFRDGDEVYLQSRGGKQMNRYFPEVVEQIQAMAPERAVLDGEVVVIRDGVQEFDLLSQRIHPAASRVEHARGGDARGVRGLRPPGVGEGVAAGPRLRGAAEAAGGTRPGHGRGDPGGATPADAGSG